ncbi:MAG: hypothetical protein WCI73_01480, partial [Phycisphaerae bacterium]
LTVATGFVTNPFIYAGFNRRDKEMVKFCDFAKEFAWFFGRCGKEKIKSGKEMSNGCSNCDEMAHVSPECAPRFSQDGPLSAASWLARAPRWTG